MKQKNAQDHTVDLDNGYIDNDIVALDGVLLQYGGYSTVDMLRREEVRIDADMGGTHIWRIGDGAVSGSQEFHNVIIGEGIEELGQYAFSRHRNIDRVVLPESLNKCGSGVFHGSDVVKLEMRRSLSGEAYDRLCLESLKVSGGLKLLRKDYRDDPRMEDMKLMYGILSGSGLKLHNAELYEKMHCLFMTRRGYKPRGYKDALFPLEGRQALGEEMYIKTMIRERFDDLGFVKSEDDYQNSLTDDIGVNMETYSYSRLDGGVISFDDKDSVYKDDGRVSVLFRYESGQIFWYTSIEVRYQGKSYFIVRRNYLVDYRTDPSIILDHGVYDEEGKLCSEEMKKTILGKYRFLSLLS